MSEYIHKVVEDKNRSIDNDDSIIAEHALNHTTSHEKKRNNIEKDFLVCLKEKGKRWEKMLEKVVDENGGSVPRVFKLFANNGSGTTANPKLHLLNQILIDWQALTKKKRSTRKNNKNNKNNKNEDEPEPECPYYQPSVQNVHIRTFFALMEEHYGWHYSLESDFTFSGGLFASLKQLYAKCHEEYGLVSDLPFCSTSSDTEF